MTVWEKARSIPIGEVARALGLPRSSGSMNCPSSDHRDRQPSFSIDALRNRCFCFGCGRGGSSIDLVTLTLGIGAADAVRWLSERFLTSHRPSHRQPLVKAQSAAPVARASGTIDSEIYSWFLSKCIMSETGLQYLRSRGISGTAATTFKLGFLENPNDITRELLIKFGHNRPCASGLVYPNASGPRLTLPRNSIIFPYFVKGQLVYLQARVAGSQAKTRWMGLKGIPKPVFNIDAIANAKMIYLCEGAFDVLSAFELGFTAIGLQGAASAIPRTVLSALRGRTVHIIPDIDDAGRRMALAATNALRSAGIQVVVQALPQGRDLNEYLTLTRGPA